MDKINFVIFVITHLLLELQVDKTARVARHFASSIHTFLVLLERYSGVQHCVSKLVKEHISLSLLGLATRRVQDKRYNENNHFFRAKWIVKYFATFDA